MKKKINYLLENVKYPLLAIALAFLIGSIFVILTDNSPIVAYSALLDGSLGNIPKFGETLLKTTPLIMTGLAVAFAFRSGLFNIGGEGQYLVGAISTVTAAWVLQDLPGFILIPIILLAGAFGGAIWGGVPGFLKAKLGVHEVIVSIMLNYIALFLTNFLVRVTLNPSTLQGTEQKAYSVMIPEHARLLKFNEFMPVFGYSSLHVGILIAIACAVGIWFLLFKTTIGYEIRSVGHNPYASEYGGISISKNIILSMMISGGLAGLGGAMTIAGLTFKVDQSSGLPGYGFTGIAVALVGKNHPLGVLASALLFGIMSNGSRKMQFEGIPKEVVGIIQGIIIIFIAGEAMLKFMTTRKKKEEKGEVA
ncbi:MAG: ABC transporter permease [Clostridia bacterium]|nr:ABC transporter permease [Clostridia bacterium]